jgi:hypothetical protein
MHSQRRRWERVKKKYNLIFNNCETFASWCKTGQKISKQVNNAVEVVDVGAKAATASSTIAVARLTTGLPARSITSLVASSAVVAVGVAAFRGYYVHKVIQESLFDNIVETGNIIYCDNCGNCTFSLKT